jgi:hypothetical protein
MLMNDNLESNEFDEENISTEELINVQEELINYSDLYKNTICGVLYV